VILDSVLTFAWTFSELPFVKGEKKSSKKEKDRRERGENGSVKKMKDLLESELHRVLLIIFIKFLEKGTAMLIAALF